MTDAAPSSPAINTVHRTYASLAQSALREMVLDGRLRPGERLNEVALAAALRISRGPLREAIQRLTIEGLLTSVSHRGAFVRSFSRGELESLYDLRTALETYAVRVGATRCNEEQVAALREVLHRTRTLLDGDSSGYPSDLDFHRRLVELVGSSEVSDAFDRVMQQITMARSRSSSDPLRARRALEEHARVLDAVVDRDGARAAEHLEAHLRGALQSALSVLAID